MRRLNKTVLATAGVLSSGVAQAALFDRGGGLIYDNVPISPGYPTPIMPRPAATMATVS
jgi:hypothetical protein